MENLHKKTHGLLRKAAVLILAALTVVSFMPAQAFAFGMENGEKCTISEGRELIGMDGKPFWMHPDEYYTARFSNKDGSGFVYRISRATTTKNTIVISDGKDSYQGYCLEHGAWLNGDATKYKGMAEEDMKNLAWLQPYTLGEMHGMKLALLFGKQPGDTSVPDDLKGKCNVDDWYFATQCIIWEYQQGLRDSPLSGRHDNPKTQNANFYSSMMYSGGEERPVHAAYEWMNDQIYNYARAQSFASAEKNKLANPISLKDNGDGTWSGVVMDRYKIGQDLKCDNEHITIDRNGNEYTITADADPSTLTGALRCVKSVKGIDAKYPLLAFTTGQEAPGYADSNHLQSVIWGAADPVSIYINFGKSTAPPAEGAPELPLFSLTAEKVDLNPGFDGDVHSGMGDAALNSTVNCSVNNNNSIVYNQDMVMGNDGHAPGPFLFAPWASLEDLDKSVVTSDENTTVTYSGTAAVTVTETVLPGGRFSEEVSGSGNGVRIHDLSYCAVSKDGGASWTYSVSFDGNVTSEFDEEAPIEAGTDTFVNDNYRGQLEIIKTKTDLDPFTGNSNGITGTEGSSSGTGSGSANESKNTYSISSRWTVQLVSGGYEGNPYIHVVPMNEGDRGFDRFAENYRVVRDTSGTAANEENPLTVSEHGRINITNLPYGRYLVSEITADSNGYVLESHEIQITEDDAPEADSQIVSTDTNNVPKVNKVRIIKINSETGKTVRTDADSTAFRIRYMGNPDSTDPKSEKNYGRYLPNGYGYLDENRNYIFRCDKNGEITLPYKLEYGKYLIEEVSVPDGYFLGNYNDTDAKKVSEIKESKDEIFNSYYFSVTEQNGHKDGSDYTTYYAIVKMPNVPVKGRIQVTKSGESLAGWRIVEGVWKPVFGKASLSGAEFEIFAAEDVRQSDGVLPIGAYDAATDGPVDLQYVSRGHADLAAAAEVRQAKLQSGEIITQTSEKNRSQTNTTVTDYEIKSHNGATYSETFSRHDELLGLTYDYDVEVSLNYADGGFSYTTVSLKKRTAADSFVPVIEKSIPQITSGGEEADIMDTVLENGNRIVQNEASVEQYEKYVKPAEEEDGVTGEEADESAGAADKGGEAEQPPDPDMFVSLTQEYNFTMAQKFGTSEGFSMTWDGFAIDAAADSIKGSAVTAICGFDGAVPEITETAGYSHTAAGGVVTFAGTAGDAAPVYFMTNDGIRTKMTMSGGLTHTTLTVKQSQLSQFDGYYPLIEYDTGTSMGYAAAEWMKDMSPGNSRYELIINDRNYIKAVRHEADKENRETFYNIEIVSDSSSATGGFRITYPDSTIAVPVLSTDGTSARLTFTSEDDTMIYPIGSSVEVITSDDNGTAASSLLPLGKYYIREISSGNGHVNSGYWKEFTLRYKDQFTPLIWDEEAFGNDVMKVRISLTKLLENSCGSKSYMQGPGAVFGLYTAENITGSGNADGETIKTLKAGQLIGRLTAGADGKGIFTGKLPCGRYYVSEIAAPAGYSLNKSKYYFQISDDHGSDSLKFHFKDAGTTGIVKEDGEGRTITEMTTLYRYPEAVITINGVKYDLSGDVSDSMVTNKVLKGQAVTSITLTAGMKVEVTLTDGSKFKVSADDEEGYTASFDGNAEVGRTDGGAISGAGNITKTVEGSFDAFKYSPKTAMTVYKGEAEYLFSGNYAKNKTAPTESEKAAVTDLLLTSPDGTESVMARLNYDSSNMQVVTSGSAESVLRSGEKADISGSFERGTELTISFADGAVFDITFDREGNVSMINSGEVRGKVIGRSEFSVNGETDMTKVAGGRMRFTAAETLARDTTDAATVNIRITGIENDALPDVSKTIIQEGEPSHILEITKADMETGETLPGAEFEILNSDHAVIYIGTTGKDGKLIVSGMEPGTYYYHETMAPDGYEADETYYAVDIVEGAAVTRVTMNNIRISKEVTKQEDKPKIKPDKPKTTPVTGTTPKTGDQSSWLYFPTILVCSGLFFFMTRRERRKIGRIE